MQFDFEGAGFRNYELQILRGNEKLGLSREEFSRIADIASAQIFVRLWGSALGAKASASCVCRVFTALWKLRVC
jgi:hypothetical protein